MFMTEKQILNHTIAPWQLVKAIIHEEEQETDHGGSGSAG